jgi:hypothetical protein
VSASAAIGFDEFEIGSCAPADRQEAWGSVLDDTHLPWRLEAPGDGQSRQDAWVRLCAAASRSETRLREKPGDRARGARSAK